LHFCGAVVRDFAASFVHCLPVRISTFVNAIVSVNTARGLSHYSERTRGRSAVALVPRALVPRAAALATKPGVAVTSGAAMDSTEDDGMWTSGQRMGSSALIVCCRGNFTLV